MEQDRFNELVTPSLLLETMAEGVVVLDRSFRIRVWNPAMTALTGHTAEEVLGRPASWLRSPECTSTHMEDLLSAASGDGVARVTGRECRLVGRNGSSVAVLVNARPLRSPDGEVLGVLQTVMDYRPILQLRREVEGLRKGLREGGQVAGMVGRSKAMTEVLRLIRLAAGSDATVLIQGESGTGKELAAAAIHEFSHRAKGPLVQVNCGTLAEGLLESELFGHVKGAYTGAYRDRTGRFEAANGGTLFLDEIGDISPALQVKLLRVLQEGLFERVGESRTRHTDVRVVAATHRNLLDEVREGRFREDLFYRLRVFPLSLPPLRDRAGDVPLLVEHFVHRFAGETGRPIEGISSAAMQRLTRYRWPGNIRELENAIEYAFVVCHRGVIQPEHLPAEITDPRFAPARGVAAGHPVASCARARTLDVLAEPEKLLEVLEASAWNKAEAARRLGVSRTLVWKWMKRLEIPLQRPEKARTPRDPG